jgi:hypothetical protein
MKEITISTHPFENLPTSPGIYAVYINFGLLYKPIQDSKKFPDKTVRVKRLFQKIIDSHILSKPQDASIGLYGRVRNNLLRLSSDHEIIWDEDIDNIEDRDIIVKFISIMTILSKPIYIGKTIEKTIQERIFQHRDKLVRIGPDDDEASRGKFSSRDKLPHKLYRRGIDFKDLLIMCAPADPGVPDDAVSLAETLLQALANPSLSVSN